jgi:hypothetical protein
VISRIKYESHHLESDAKRRNVYNRGLDSLTWFVSLMLHRKSEHRPLYQIWLQFLILANLRFMKRVILQCPYTGLARKDVTRGEHTSYSPFGEDLSSPPYHFLLRVAADSVVGEMRPLCFFHDVIAAVRSRMSLFFLRAFLERVAPSTLQATR